MNMTNKYIDMPTKHLSSVCWESNGIFFRMYPFEDEHGVKASFQSYEYYTLKFERSFKWFTNYTLKFERSFKWFTI